MMAVWTCPKCKVTIMTGRSDPPGCPCCGYNREVKKQKPINDKPWKDGKKGGGE